MPDALELPGMLRAVVELVRSEWLAGIRRRVVDEFVALAGRHAVRRLGHPAARCLPRLAAVARALDDLAEPPAGLRRVQAVRIGGGSLHVVDLPACEVRAADIPALALAVRCQNEGSLSRADQYSYSAHDPLLSLWPRHGARKHNSRISHSPSHPGQCCWCRRMKVRAMASRSACGGGPWFSAAFTIERNRMYYSPRGSGFDAGLVPRALPMRRARGLAIDRGRPHRPARARDAFPPVAARCRHGATIPRSSRRRLGVHVATLGRTASAVGMEVQELSHFGVRRGAAGGTLAGLRSDPHREGVLAWLLR